MLYDGSYWWSSSVRLSEGSLAVHVITKRARLLLVVPICLLHGLNLKISLTRVYMYIVCACVFFLHVTNITQRESKTSLNGA